MKINPSKVPVLCYECGKRALHCRENCAKYKIYDIAIKAERKKRKQEKQGEADFIRHVINSADKAKRRLRK